MAWEWSHTQEGLDYARNFLNTLPVSELAIMAAEWDTYAKGKDEDEVESFDQEYYKAREAHYLTLPADVLADLVWEAAEDFRTCENGGSHLWGCPYGCHGHLLPVGDDADE